MKIERKFPPNIEDIIKKFGAIPVTAVFTYGDTIYSPSNGNIDVYLMSHEETHTKQQGTEIDAWWKKYLNDNLFRLKQEVEAYTNQYVHFCKNKKDPVRQMEFLDRLAQDLSSPMYGNVCSLEDARKFIKQGHV